MKTVTVTVNGALLVNGTGSEVQVGQMVKLFLDTEANSGFPDFILGTVQHPITKVNCGSATSYPVEYNEADLDSAANFIKPQDVVDTQALQFTTLFIAPTTDPGVPGAVWNDGGTLAISAGA